MEHSLEQQPSTDCVLRLPKEGLFGVADGKAGSKEAAQVVLTEAVEGLGNRFDETLNRLRARGFSDAQIAVSVSMAMNGLFQRAHAALRGQARDGRPVLATGTVAKLHAFPDGTKYLYLGHVGDTRAWRFVPEDSGGRLERLTTDDSQLTRWVAEGKITTAEAESVEQYRSKTELSGPYGAELPAAAGRLHNILGHEQPFSVQFLAEPLSEKDIIILTNNRVHGNMTPDEIRQIAALPLSDDAVAKQLQKTAEEIGRRAPGTHGRDRRMAGDAAAVVVRVGEWRPRS